MLRILKKIERIFNRYGCCYLLISLPEKFIERNIMRSGIWCENLPEGGVENRKGTKGRADLFEDFVIVIHEYKR